MPVRAGVPLPSATQWAAVITVFPAGVWTTEALQ
jgi:hypothetical protein